MEFRVKIQIQIVKTAKMEKNKNQIKFILYFFQKNYSFIYIYNIVAFKTFKIFLSYTVLKHSIIILEYLLMKFDGNLALI